MSSNGNIWVVDDERSIRWVLEKALTQNGWTVECFESAEQLLEQLHVYYTTSCHHGHQDARDRRAGTLKRTKRQSSRITGNSHDSSFRSR